MDVRACLVERRNVAGEGKHEEGREGRTWDQEEAVGTELQRGERHGCQVWDLDCSKPVWRALKGGSGRGTQAGKTGERGEIIYTSFLIAWPWRTPRSLWLCRTEGGLEATLAVWFV